MIEPEPSSRQQLVAGAADMIRRRGLNATSIREVAKYAGTPLGSTYHYFPGGKHQLAAEAIRFAGDTVGSMLAAKLRTGPVDGLRAFFALWRDILTGTDFRAGCPSSRYPSRHRRPATSTLCWPSPPMCSCDGRPSSPNRCATMVPIRRGPRHSPRSSLPPAKAPWPCAGPSAAPAPSTRSPPSSPRW
jgi:AcrR family transcriptional regulator